MNQQYLYSVIIPTYNRGHLLADALDSIFAQRIRPIQVIVIDDGSTDHTREIVAGYGQRVIYRFQENRGPAAARNLGLVQATGRWIAFLDSDDVWLPGKLARELDLFEKFPLAEVILSDSEKWLENERVSTSWFGSQGLDPIPLRPTLMRRSPSSGWHRGKVFATCSMTIAREALLKLGAPVFDTSLVTHEDWEFALRIHHLCRILILPEVFARVRRFQDDTRGDRPLPGSAVPTKFLLARESQRAAILERALTWSGWTGFVRREIEAELTLTKERIARIDREQGNPAQRRQGVG